MIKKVILFGLLIFILVGIGGATWSFSIARSLPSPELIESRRVAESTKIYDRTGEVLLYEIHGEEKRTVIPFEEIPEFAKEAAIAIEDENFYTHAAFEFRAVLRAFITNLLRGGVVQGGSTITQQLAKNAFLTPERTIARKVKELILSFQLEKKFTKNEILSLYLNQIPYGSNAYGIEAASQLFFEKSARDLSLAEATLLASLPKAPTFYSPWGSHVDALMSRKDTALEKMFTLGFISEGERDAALEETLVFASPSSGIRAPHFVIMVQEYLNNQYGEDFVRTGGLSVTTTLDWELQELAEKVVAEGATRNEELYKGTNAALVAEDSTTGQVLALVGSRDYFDTDNEGNFNVASQGLRQPGSAIKPFIYAAAFKAGYTPETVVFDVETEFDTTEDPLKSYMPQNYDTVFRGPVAFREALAQSINVPAVKVLYLAGLDAALRTARDFGLVTLTEKARYGLSLVLGGGEVTLLDLTHAYSVFSQDGVRREQALLLEVRSKDRVLEKYKNKEERVIDNQYARLINDVLSDVNARSGLFSSSLPLTTIADHEVALKTGTTNDYRDAWTIGYSPDLVVGVWAGNNDNSPMEQQGGSILAAVPMWNAFMRTALLARPSLTFPQPEVIIPQKPVLRGEYIVQFTAEATTSPQVHNLLFYVDKKNPQGPRPKTPSSDSQYENWEAPVLEWAEKNISGFASFNQPLAPDSTAVYGGSSTFLGDAVVISIEEPQHGSAIGTTLTFRAKITAKEEITNIQLVFNGLVVDSRSGSFGNENDYFFSFTPSSPPLQSLLALTVVAGDASATKELILFK